MAARVSIPPTPAAEKAPDPASQKRGAVALRLELEADEDPARRAALSYELSRIHELGGDLAAAARDALGATNHAAGFIEPLEALIAIALRRRSKGNLEKLLERLLRVSRTPSERLRAGLELFGHLTLGGDFARAEEVLLGLQEENPDDATLWLARQVLASHQGSEPGLLSALLGRTASARSGHYRADLLQAAGLRTLGTGLVDEGLSLLQQAFDEQPTFGRARLAERTARAAGRLEQALSFAGRLAEMSDRASDADDEADQRAVPALERGSAGVARSTLRKALYATQLGDDAEAMRLLTDLSEQAPNDWLLLALRRDLAERRDADEHARFEHERFLLERALGASSPEQVLDAGDKGALELELAFVARALGDSEAHARHLERAADALPRAQVPRAALLSLSSKSSPAQLARALATSGDVFSGPARAAYLTASALIWATTEPGQALGALDAAREAGQNAQVVRRILRVVALLSGGADLVLAADLSLLEGARESRPLGWEILRLALLGRSEAALQKALAVVAEGAPGRKLAGAFLGEARTRSLAELGVEIGGGAIARALTLAQVRRELAEGSDTGRKSARARLTELVETQPGDSLATAALLGLLGASDPRESARLLVRAAESSADPDLAAAWATRAAVNLLHAGRTSDAVRALNAAAPLESNAWGLSEQYLLRALGDAALGRRSALQQRAAATGHSAAALELACELAATDRAQALGQLRALRAVAPVGSAAELDGVPDEVLDWLEALLVAGQPDAAEDRSVPVTWRADEQAFLEFVGSRARGSNGAADAADAAEPADPVSGAEQAASAQVWLEQSLALNGPLAETTLDAALVSAVLSGQQGQSADEARALLVIGQALGHPWLAAQAHARLARSSPSSETRAESKNALLSLADAHPDSAELSWAALEVREATDEARPILLERLATSLAAGDGDEAEVATLELLLAFEELRVHANATALTRLEKLQTTLPGDPTVLHGLLIAAQRQARPELEVQALTALAEKCNDDTRASALWERAGDLYLHALAQPQAAEEAFCAALGRAPRRVSAFARVYQLAKSRGDKPRLVELIDARLDVARQPHARLELLWEKARLCRTLGRRASCRKALEALLELEPGHLPALALSAEMHLADERFELGAESLRTIAEHPDTPQNERAQAGLHASDLLERLHRPREAVALLEVLERFGAPRPDILERRARTAARAEAWDVAYGAFRELHDSSTSTDLRLQGARMMLAIQRDHLKQPGALDDAAVRVLLDAPTEGDAVDVLLAGDLPAEEKQRLLGPAIEEARERLRLAPLHPGHLARLADLCAAGGEARLERLALATWALTGTLSDERRRRLERATTPLSATSHVLSSEEFDEIASAGELGVPGALARAFSPFVARLTRPSLESLGASPLMRVDPFADHPARREVAELVRLLGLVDFELYLGGNDPARLISFDAELPTLLIGSGVQFPLSPRDRARLLTAIYGAARGFGGLWALPSEGARLWLGALLVALGRKPGLEAGPQLEERAQALGQVLPRETREELTALVDAIVSGGGDPLGFANSARIGAARLACFLHGDPSILRSLPRLVPEETESRRQLLTDVVAFVFSHRFGSLRQRVGLEAS